MSSRRSCRSRGRGVMSASGSLHSISVTACSSDTGRLGRHQGCSVRVSTALVTATFPSEARPISVPTASVPVVDSRNDLAIIHQEFQSFLQQSPPSSATPLSQPAISTSPGLPGVGWFL
uniref:Uncharacterized protein n=1 Tax=Amphimedon queenslandica TaxID=400682 RepID=A0A1X7VWX3_AMPQE